MIVTPSPLIRGAGDFASFTAKTTPIGADILLIEDSADSNNKKKILLSDFPGAKIKEVFFEVETASTAYKTNFRVRAVGTSGNFSFNFKVPFDFVSLIEITAQMFVESGAVGTGKNIDLSSNYCAIGEVYSTHGQSDTVSTYNLGSVADGLAEISLASVFNSPGIGAGDICGVNITHSALGGSVNYVGLRLKYNVF